MCVLLIISFIFKLQLFIIYLQFLGPSCDPYLECGLLPRNASLDLFNLAYYIREVGKCRPFTKVGLSKCKPIHSAYDSKYLK